MSFHDYPQPSPWTPLSLAALDTPPVFMLAPPPRGERALRYALRAEGLTFHGDAELRAEAERALRVLWPEELAEDGLAKLKSMWDCLDRGDALAPDDAAALDGLTSRLRRAWPRLAEMAADDAEYIEEAPKIAASLAVAGWSSLPVSYERISARVPLETLDGAQKALAELERAAGLEPGTAWLELTAKSLAIINGTADAPAPNPTPAETPAPEPSEKPARRRNRGASK